MGESAQRLIWFAVAAAIISYAVFIIAGSALSAQSAGINDPVVIRDELAANQHTLSGMVMVQTPCDELSVDPHTLSANIFVLSFRTWHEPSVDCPDEPTPRPFRTQIFAPAADVDIIATVDGAPLQIVLLPAVSASK